MDDFAQIIEEDMTVYLKSEKLDKLKSLAEGLSQTVQAQYDTGVALILVDVIGEISKRKKEEVKMEARIGDLKECVECGKLFSPEYQGDPEDVSCQECIDKRNSTMK